MLLIVSEFGDWLKEHRLAQRWSLRELETRINKICTFGYLDQLEKDVRGKKGNPVRPDIEIVDALARAFGEPVRKVRQLAGHPVTASVRPQTLDELFSALEALGIARPIFSDPPELFTPDDLQEIYDNITDELERTLRRLSRKR